MSPPAALLFDLDGCLVDSLPSIARCWSETLTGFGLPAPTPEQVRPHVGPPVDVAARALAPGADEATVEAIVADYRQRSARATDVVPFPGIPELLGVLTRRGMRLGIATSKSIEVAEPQLARLHLRRWFEVVEGTEVHELGADKATIVARALERLDPIRPIALVGDREHDVRGAHANGLGAIGVLWGYGSRDELVGAGADQLVRDPAEIAPTVSRMTSAARGSAGS
jgi:phosphoglycolate phosphatase